MNIRLYTRLALAMLLMLAVGASQALAQTLLSQYRPGVTPDGAVYFLPKTAVRISVLVEKSTYTPGDFSPYAQRYMRIAKVSQQPSTSYRIISVSQQPIPVADSTKVYAVKFDPKTVASRLTLADDGRLLAINMDDVDDYDFPEPFTAMPRQELPDPRQYMGEDILSCGSTAKMAEMTAHEVYDLRENRTMLIKGQADFMPQDGRQMQLMLDEIDRQEQSLASLFTGITRRDTTEHIVIVTPEAPMQRTMAFRLSQVHGFTDVDDLSGTPFYITIDDITQLPAAEPEKKKGKQVPGIFVNVPGKMRSTLYDGIDVIATADMAAPQFGQTLLLSGSLFNKRYTTRLLLNALTGAIARLDADQPK